MGGRILSNVAEIVFVAIVGWLYLTVLRQRPRVPPIGHRIRRAKRNALRRNRYTLPGEWS